MMDPFVASKRLNVVERKLISYIDKAWFNLIFKGIERANVCMQGHINRPIKILERFKNHSIINSVSFCLLRSSRPGQSTGSRRGRHKSLSARPRQIERKAFKRQRN